MLRSKRQLYLFVFLTVLSCDLIHKYNTNLSLTDSITIPESILAGLPSSIHITIPKEFFSACLLVSDDNFRLAEWIAYHYHVLPLRYLVIASDPISKHSPKPVLDVFRQHLKDLTILLWNDSQFPFERIFNETTGIKGNNVKNHRKRQMRFNSECLNHLYQQRGISWTAMWDIDEFIAFNGFNVTRQNPATTGSTSTNFSATSPPDMSEAGAVLRYLKDYGEATGVAMHRVFVGNKELPSLLNESHPVDPRRFDTLRYRWEADFAFHRNGPGKCMGNVQKIKTFPVDDGNPHQPSPCICPEILWPGVNDPGPRPFYVKHYAGSWEAYSYRDDRRAGTVSHNYRDYVKRSNFSGHLTHGMSPWMSAFWQNVGSRRAAALFQTSGLDPDYNSSVKMADI